MVKFGVNGLFAPQSPVLSRAPKKEVSVQPQVHEHNIKQSML